MCAEEYYAWKKMHRTNIMALLSDINYFPVQSSPVRFRRVFATNRTVAASSHAGLRWSSCLRTSAEFLQKLFAETLCLWLDF